MVPDPKLLAAAAKSLAVTARSSLPSVSAASPAHLGTPSAASQPSAVQHDGPEGVSTSDGLPAAAAAHVLVVTPTTAGSAIPFTPITLVWRDLR